MKQFLISKAISAIEAGLIPDGLVRAGIRRLCRQRLEEVKADCQNLPEMNNRNFVQASKSAPIAPLPELANEQHYEVPAEFYNYVLGPRRKYSSCYYQSPTTTLAEAEIDSLTMSCEHADLKDGQRILELGCGWGSLTLWMAEHYPNSSITAVSNSNSQREFITQELKKRGWDNRVRVITKDMNEFDTTETFDRVVSIEMFEHMRNYEVLLNKVSRWLAPNGKVFIHIFCHKSLAYTFEREGAANWMGRYFFSGGIMPSEDLFDYHAKDLTVTQRWRWNGNHYRRTADDWVANMDRNRKEIMAILERVYGKRDAAKWFRRWRILFLAGSELFGYGTGDEWYVTHYQFEHSQKESRIPRTV